MTPISRDQIIGARIVAIHISAKINDWGLDEHVVYFTVDRGFSFVMPFIGATWNKIDIPGDAKPIIDPITITWRTLFSKRDRGSKILEQVRELTIVRVIGDPEQPDDTFILLSDGSRLSNTMVAPHGTGAAGLYFFNDSKEFHSNTNMIDFFDIPKAT